MSRDETNAVTLSRELSEEAFELVDARSTQSWLIEVDKELDGTTWSHLGGIENNVHTVDPP